MTALPAFPERVLAAVEAKGGPVVVGLDPRPELLPDDLIAWARRQGGDPREAAAAAVAAFNRVIIDAVHDVAVAVKPQLAFFEQLGWPGVRALEETIAWAKERGLLVIADGKRHDIGTTAAAYARAYLGLDGGPSGGVTPLGSCASGLEADALTVSPYMGTDSMEPFLAACRERGKGIFVLVRTSNPSGAELQDMLVGDGAEPRATLADRVADLVVKWNDGMPHAGGYGPVGAVVGATGPDEAARLRRRMPGVLFLVPGYGAQGAGPQQAAAAFADDGRGALVNSARQIQYAWRSEHPGAPGTADDYAGAARRAALRMRAELWEAVSGKRGAAAAGHQGGNAHVDD